MIVDLTQSSLWITSEWLTSFSQGHSLSRNLPHSSWTSLEVLRHIHTPKKQPASKAIGFLHAQRISALMLYLEDSDKMEILYLATRPNYTGCGHMKKLFLWVLRQSQIKQRPIWLEVSENNTPAKNLYKKLGLQQSGPPRQKYYSDGSACLNYTYTPQ